MFIVTVLSTYTTQNLRTVHVHVHDRSVIETRRLHLKTALFSGKKMNCLGRDLNPQDSSAGQAESLRFIHVYTYRIFKGYVVPLPPLTVNYCTLSYVVFSMQCHPVN